MNVSLPVLPAWFLKEISKWCATLDDRNSINTPRGPQISLHHIWKACKNCQHERTLTKLNKSSTSQTNSSELVPQFEMERAAPCIHRRTNRETPLVRSCVTTEGPRTAPVWHTTCLWKLFFFFHTLRKETLPSGLRRYNENLIKKKLNKNMR